MLASFFFMLLKVIIGAAMSTITPIEAAAAMQLLVMERNARSEL